MSSFYIGVSRSMELCTHAGIRVYRDIVKQVVAECDACNSIDPNVISWDERSLAVGKVREKVSNSMLASNTKNNNDSLQYYSCLVFAISHLY